MEKSEIYARVDHTLLSPCAVWEQIEALCEEALQFHTASVCIPPSYVERATQRYGDRLKICTVVGFPLGYSTTACKTAETAEAVANGADEIDMVINLGDVKSGAFSAVAREIAAVKKAAGGRTLKVIVETCYLTREEKMALCHCVTESGADYIKTSTGFGSSGAAMEDIELFRQHIGPKVKIKAAGGIRTAADMEAFLKAGCSRIGTSSAVKALG
ncbi:MAG: deoxyribose-phosphate aldolase [Oscillospiraceae bacterium]|nr:deoxyribose-phosphate aldolase [Oscillospiraceae bacterium]